MNACLCMKHQSKFWDDLRTLIFIQNKSKKDKAKSRDESQMNEENKTKEYHT